MAKILVTGGAGYIGSITTKQLLDSGHNVVVVDTLENGHKEAVDPRAKLIVANVGDQEAMKKVFSEEKPEAVIDFAAYLAVGESMTKPEKYLENNVLNFIKLLDTMTECGIKKIIKSSTAAVYGDPAHETDFPLKEDHLSHLKSTKSALLGGEIRGQKTEGEDFFRKFIDLFQSQLEKRPELRLTEAEMTQLRIPTSIYGLTKLLDEILLQKYDHLHGVKSIALRYFNVAGADPGGEMGEDKPNPTNLMSVTIYKALGKRDQLEVFGNDFPTKDGTGVRDYIHVCDLAAGHLAALAYLLEKNESNTFNLGTGHGNTVLEVIQAVEKASGKKIEYKISPRRAGDLAVSYANAEKAKQILGWSPQYNISDMAQSAWQWHSTHPRGIEG